MWNYEKRLQYPVNITTPNPKIAQVIHLLAQRYTMPYRNVAGLLTDIGSNAAKLRTFAAAARSRLYQIFRKIKHQPAVFPLRK